MSWKISVSEQVKLQMEITNHCNAACPACARGYLASNKTDAPQYGLSLNDTYISLEKFKSYVDKDKWTNLDRILFCGN